MTHTMCEALRRGHPRAKTDEALRACAEKGGVIGIAALGYFLGPDPGGETTIEDYANHIEHAVSVAGREHVALASDFPPQGIRPWATRENWYLPRLESFEPSYEVRWPPWIPELDTPNRFLNSARVLERRGWTEHDLELLLGRNWLRLFRDTIG
jgi:membrane dipeptidase